MSLLVCTNAFIRSRAEAARDFLDTSFSLHLFSNDFSPNCASLISDFTEVFFPGYAPQIFGGTLREPLKIADGWYRLASGLFSFLPTADSDQLIYGWYVSRGSEVVLCNRFDFPFGIGNLFPIEFTLSIDDVAQASGIV